MPSIATVNESKAKHVVAWVREQLGLTQGQLANMIGSSRHTIQSIELGRMALSERFAYALNEATGIRAKWFLANELGAPPPDAAEVQEQFKEAQRGAFKGKYAAHLAPQMALWRTLTVLLAIADELGPDGCNASGFYHILFQMTHKLRGCIGDNKTRIRINRANHELVKEGGDERVLSFLLAKLQETQRALPKAPGKPPGSRKKWPQSGRI